MSPPVRDPAATAPEHQAPPHRPTATCVLRARAPLRLSFAGGGTDVPPFPEIHGGLVLSATINRFAHGTLVARDDGHTTIESADLDLALSYRAGRPLPLDGRLDLVKAAISRFSVGSEQRGLDLFLRSGAPPGSGLGSSSSMVVTLVGLLKELHGLALSDHEVADLAVLVERSDLGLSGGLQDHYAAAFGGFNFIEFHGDRVVVNPLRVRPETVMELEHNLLLCYTGTTRASDRIIADQVSRFESGESEAVAGLWRQKELAVEMKEALLRGRLNTLGELLGHAWTEKRRLSPKITSPFIEELYEIATKNGALGGKVTGAGGGGFMILYCDYRRKHRVAEAVTRVGATVYEFAFELGGLRTWRAPDA